MTAVDGDARALAGAGLAAALRDSRARSWAVVDDLPEGVWLPPEQPGVNPIAWELAHLAWFAEFWVLRGPHRRGADGRAEAQRPARHAVPDAHFDSARSAHAARWRMPLPQREALQRVLAGQLEDCIAALPGGGAHEGEADDAGLYFHRLALFHEDMHGEAFTWLRSTLGAPAPAGCLPPLLQPRAAVGVVGGEVSIGRPDALPGFAFDNEQRAQTLRLAEFEIDATPVTAGQFLRFVEAGGYDLAQHWPGAAGAWRATVDRRHPAHWRRLGGDWQVRWFDRWLPLAPDAPVMHVNAFEAEAWCAWAGRRLPRAAEWEHAAPQLDWGHSVWEWTADAFTPYPGFTAGPYVEYSAPWFGNHRELRGGAFATHDRLHSRHYRNFFLPQRDDIFAGFRSAAR